MQITKNNLVLVLVYDDKMVQGLNYNIQYTQM